MLFNVETTVTLEDGLPQYEVQNWVHQDLANKSFSQPVCPMMQLNNGAQLAYDGKLPHNLTDLNDNELGYWLGMVTEYQHYVNWCVAEAQMNRNSSTKELDMVSAKLRLSYKYDENGKKRTEQERDDMMTLDGRFVEAQSRALYYEGYHRFVQMIQKNADQTYNAISRRITQRGQDLERERRASNIQGYQGPPQFRRPGTGP